MIMSGPKTDHLQANDWTLGQNEAKQPRRRQRKPRLDRTIREAEKAGKSVTSITTPDGVKLTFGEPAPDTSDEWDRRLDRGKH
jgi:hypothetical protein